MTHEDSLFDQLKARKVTITLSAAGLAAVGAVLLQVPWHTVSEHFAGPEAWIRELHDSFVTHEELLETMERHTSKPHAQAVDLMAEQSIKLERKLDKFISRYDLNEAIDALRQAEQGLLLHQLVRDQYADDALWQRRNLQLEQAVSSAREFKDCVKAGGDNCEILRSR